jgi:hypothetical protein
MNNIVREMLYSKKDKPPKVYLFNNDSVANNFIDPEFCFSYDGEKLQQIAKTPGEKIIVIEDMMSQIGSDMKEKKRLEGLFSVHRHDSCHYIVVTQTFKSLPVSIRMREVSSCIYLYMGKMKGRDKMKLIHEACDVFDEFDDYVSVNQELEQYEFLKITPDNKYEIMESNPKKAIYIRSNIHYNQ